MKCPLCKVEMSIGAVRCEVEGDTSPETGTVVYTAQDLVCRCHQCENCGKVVTTRRTKIYPQESQNDNSDTI